MKRLHRTMIFFAGLMAMSFYSITGAQAPAQAPPTARPATPDWFAPAWKYPQFLSEGRFTELERQFKWLFDNGIRDENGKPWLTKAYEAFQFQGGLREKLDQWCVEYPKSHFAFTVRGQFLQKQAWKIKGNTPTPILPEESEKIYRLRLLEARADLLQGGLLEPGDPNAWCSLLYDAHALGLPGDQQEEYFQKAIKADPLFFEAYRAKLEYLGPRSGGDEKEMFEFAREQSKIAPPGSEIRLLVVYAHNEMINYYGSKNYYKQPEIWNEVQSAFGDVLKANPERLEIRNWFLKIAVSSEHWDEAGEQFDIVGPDFTLPFKGVLDYVRYRTFFKTRKTMQAQTANAQWVVDLCTQKIAKEPARARYYHIRAQALRLAGRNDLAIADWQKAVELEPEAYGCLMEIGNTYMINLQQAPRAVEFYRRALKVNPRSDEIAQHLEQALVSSVQWDEARKIMETVRRNRPDVKAPYEPFVMSYFAGNDFEEGLRFTGDCLKHADAAYREPMLYLLAGHATFAEKLRKNDLAAADYEAALKIDPYDNITLSHYAILLSDPASEKLRDTSRALSLALGATASTREQDAWDFDSLGRVYENLKQPEDAAKAYHKALGLDSAVAHARQRLAVLDPKPKSPAAK